MQQVPAIALSILFSSLSAVGCRGASPCTGCEEQAERDTGDTGDGDGDGDEPLPDLPCGGADLMTDNLNCGTCGNECVVWYEGTEWQAGGCEQGECSRAGWSSCSAENVGATCEEICLGRECLPGGCSGLTAMVFEVGHFSPCPHAEAPQVAMTGACDEPIPWEVPDNENMESSRAVKCCCEY